MTDDHSPPIYHGEYIKRARQDDQHRCRLPVAEHLGDMFRCTQDHIWVVGQACDMCHHYGEHNHAGAHTVGLTWRPANWWQRLRVRCRTMEPARRAKPDR